jgi:hypothetical protein
MAWLRVDATMTQAPRTPDALRAFFFASAPFMAEVFAIDGDVRTLVAKASATMAVVKA